MPFAASTRLMALVVFASLLGMHPATRAAQSGAAALDLTQPVSETPWKRYRVDSQGSRWPQTDWKAYSNVANLGATSQKPVVMEIKGPITGDPAKGRKLAFDRARGGSCLACHVMGPEGGAQPGNVGPDLSEIGAQRTDEWLFQYIYDPRKMNPNTIMPPWGAHAVYTVEEVKDMVAFLKTLKTRHAFKDPKENPATRPVPVESRDNLDPTENSGMFAVDEGKALYAKAGPAGPSCASCHAKPEQAFKTWAATMPRWEPRLKKVIGIEEFVTRHARATTGAVHLMQSDANLALSIYLRHLANGTPMNPDVSSQEAKQAIARASRTMAAKLGQLNISCNDCHTKDAHANKWARGQYLVEFKGTVAHFPTFRTSRGDIWDIRKRFQWCNVSVRANELPPEAAEYGDIELALAAMNRGEKINVPGIRH